MERHGETVDFRPGISLFRLRPLGDFDLGAFKVFLIQLQAGYQAPSALKDHGRAVALLFIHSERITSGHFVLQCYDTTAWANSISVTIKELLPTHWVLRHHSYIPASTRALIIRLVRPTPSSN